MRLYATLLCLFALARCAFALGLATVPTADGAGLAQATVETDDYRVRVNFEQGARIAEFTDKHLGADGVAWGDPAGSGFLDDRHVFTAMPYQTGAVRETAERITIPSSVRSGDGVELRKTFVFERGKPFVRVRYEVLNHGFVPYRLWVKCLGVPGGGERTEGDISVSFFSQGELKSADPWPAEAYYPEVHGGWMALLRKPARAGYFVRAEPTFLESFYFWSHSTTAPTFEWLYKPVAPGHSFRTDVLIGLLRGVDAVGHIDAQGRVSADVRAPAAPPEPEYAAIAGWRSLDELYAPTEEEMARGFIPTVLSASAPRQRLASLRADVGMGEGEFVPVEVFALENLRGVQLEILGGAAEDGSLRAESERDYRLVPDGSVDIAQGSYGRLWLRVLPSDEPREIAGKVAVVAGDARFEMPLSVKVWPVEYPAEHRLPFKSYSGANTLGMNAYLDGEDEQRFPANLDMLQALGCRVFETTLTFNPAIFLKYVREKETGEPFYEHFAKHGPFAPDALPDLDFSALDPAVAHFHERGMMRFEMNVGMSGYGARWQQVPSFAQRALGRRIEDEDEGYKLLLWLAGQVREYMEGQGYSDFWVKISDEIAASAIPPWLATAERYRAAGFRAYTTNSIGIPGSAELLRRMDEQSDGWQLATSFLRDFIERTRRGTSVAEHRHAIEPPSWGQYTNGGAVNTYVPRRNFNPFPEGVNPDHVEDLVVSADGVALDMTQRGPWGNRREDVAYRIGRTLYISLADGRHPKDAELAIEYKVRRVDEGGEPAVQLSHADSVWYYGGGGYFTSGYLRTRRANWIGVYYGLHGRGHYVCKHWLPERRMWWYEGDGKIVSSPAYEGLRDSADDSAYYRRLVDLGADEETLRSIVGHGQGAALRLVEHRRQAMAWDDVDDSATYEDFNRAKRRMLELLDRLEGEAAVD